MRKIWRLSATSPSLHGPQGDGSADETLAGISLAIQPEGVHEELHSQPAVDRLVCSREGRVIVWRIVNALTVLAGIDQQVSAVVTRDVGIDPRVGCAGRPAPLELLDAGYQRAGPCPVGRNVRRRSRG
jgi:hypothetical protein